ncbi:MAG: carboxypeptidase regulatory-like domain-containing protein [Candidatus Eremiobacteraeota bacterium]|nr:carboxypeptidase regulatory-like domain-containing protein [Candidatus Eremiobacteraeota bacterium]
MTRIRDTSIVSILLVALLVASTGRAWAASGRIIGKVVEAGTGAPLSGVSITATGPMHAQTVTSGAGTFSLNNLIPGSYILITTFEGYGTSQTNGIMVGEGMEQSVTITLTRQSDTATLSLGSSNSVPPPLFTYAGDLRAYYFGRTNGNTCLTCKVNKGTPNALAFNFGGELHGQLNVPHTPWSVAATYFGAFPFGANWPGPLNNIGYNPQVDNTLPGYTLNLFGESYVQYKTPGVLFQTGHEIIYTPWANGGDSRMLPESFQGTLISGNVTPNLNLGAMYMARFRTRVISAFNSNTLLTSCNTANPTGKGPVEGVSGTFTVPGDPCNKQQTTYGFSEFSASYKFGSSGLVANVNQYQVYDISSMTWVTAQYNFMKQSKFNPYVAGQFLAENNFGTSVIGTVHSYTSGGQFGMIIYPNLLFTVGYDGSPSTAYVVPAKECKGTASSPAAASPGVIFGGVASTTNKTLPKGEVTCYGGGLASPYTDNQATDPLYTTSLTQGMADVHKPGTSEKVTLGWQSNDKRLKALVSDAWYNYSLPGNVAGVGNGDSRAEFNIDIQYFFNPVRPGPYKGLSIRQRYGDRTQFFTPYDFKYSRTQLEYTF